MARKKMPQKVLVIKDCTFILPDGFEGTTEDAFEEFLKYREKHLHEAQFVDKNGLFSAFSLLLHAHDKHRVCGEYMLYELKNGKYELIEETKEQEPILDLPE